MMLSNLIDHKLLFDMEITGITNNSSNVKPGYIFVVEPKAKKYIKDAINKGAVFLILEEEINIDFPHIVVNSANKSFSELSKKFFNFPDEKLKMIGITGTYGKTTTTWLLHSIYNKAGLNAGLIGTIEYKIGEEITPATLTTPEPFEIYSLLNKLVSIGGKVCIMEVTSHALALERVSDISFHIAGFTGLGHDHIDFHRNFDEYKNAKMKLFKNLNKSAYAILNKDDKYFDEFAKNTNANIMTYSVYSEADLKGKILTANRDGLNVLLYWKGKEYKIYSPLVGEYNIYNILLSTLCAFIDNIDIEVIKEGIINVKIPGRFEFVTDRIIIDYAHTPEELSAVLTSAKKLTKGRIICVFGCGGNRDKEKRPIMGSVASELADYVIITTDNPRNEDPLIISKEITKGMKNSNFEIILNRKEAIKMAIERSSEEDLIVIAGKGHENYQIYGDFKVPWDERKIIKEILKVKI